MNAGKNKLRLVTRSDFDGLVCAVILQELQLISDIKFVHPKDMQDGLIKITDSDVTTNLPYVKGVHLAFDHHVSETLRIKEKPNNHIIDPNAPSAARVVYNYYGGAEKLPNISEEMMEAVDKADSAQFSKEEIGNPNNWVLLNFIMDARTGLGRYNTFRISNYYLMMHLIYYCKNHTIEEILELPDVKERVEMYLEHQDLFREQIQRNTKVYDNLIVVDLREEEQIYVGNRFVKYTLHPQCTTSILVMWGLSKNTTVFTVGASIVNRSGKTNIGELMLKYGGGGHKNAGTCQVPTENADSILEELIASITK